MKYSELVESGATEAKRQDFLAEGEQTPITLRVPKNLKDAAAEAASFVVSASLPSSATASSTSFLGGHRMMPIETPEQKARKKIDKQLNDAGWDIVPRDEYVPKNAQAVEEMLMQGNKESDYLLFVDDKAIAVVEAKREENSLVMTWQTKPSFTLPTRKTGTVFGSTASFPSSTWRTERRSISRTCATQIVTTLS